MQKNIKQNVNRDAGFSLVELSIVLVVLGLLVGGVLGGQSLIRAAELRSVMTDANAYVTAVGQFRAQYRALPGDFARATNLWAATASGDGSGTVTGVERYRAWQQLNLAAMTEKIYTGTQGAGGTEDFVIASNTPGSRVATAGFAFYYANLTATTLAYTVNMGNMITFGRHIGTNSGAPISAVLRPDDAFSIDTKMDDGRPGTGNWIANGTGGGNFGTATACTTSTSGTDYAGNYRLDLTNPACSFFIKTGF